MNFAQIILTPFVWLLTAFYNLTGSYGLALILFALVVKLILFPFSLKGKRSMIQMNMLSGKMQKLQKQYGKDRERYNMEVQKLYEKEKVNPMGGCLWSFLPLPILMALYVIIRRPMMYLMGIPDAAVTSAIKAVADAGVAFTGNQAYHELQLAGMLKDSSVMDLVSSAIPDYADKLSAINFSFFGIDLSQVPSLKFWTRFDTLGTWGAIGLFLIPLAVTALNFWYTKYSMKSNQNLAESSEEQKKKKKKPKEEVKSAQERSNQMMMWMMPLMYLWFGYSMPAGMCIYMAANALCTVGQEAIFNKILRKDIDKMKAEAAEREEKEKAELAARKAEIAERRRLQEEANKANKGKKKAKKPASAKKPANKNGRIGIRTYALGRDYDPDRYGGVTAYRDPQEIIDEQAVEDAYKKKRRRKADAVEQALQQAEEAGDLEAVKKLEEKQAELAEAEEAAEEAAELTETEVEVEAAAETPTETPAEEGSIADETFAQLNAETSAEADAEAEDQSSDDNA